MKKKLFGVFLLGVMILSMLSVCAFAKQEKTTGKGYRVLSAETAVDVMAETEPADEEGAETAPEDEAEEEVAEEGAPEALKGRLKKLFVEAKGKFREAKQEVAECEEEDTDCEQAKVQLRTHAKEYLLRTADKVINSLERIKARAEDADLIAELGEQIAAMEEAKATIEASESKEEIVGAARAIRSAWKETKKVMRKAVDHILGKKIGEIVVRAENLEVKLDRILNKLKEKGIDTSALEARVEEFAALIAKATAQKEVGEYREAHQSLKEAHFVLMKTVVGIKQARGGEETLEMSEEELAEEPEETEEEEAEEETEEEGDMEDITGDVVEEEVAAEEEETEEDSDESIEVEVGEEIVI